MGEGARAGEKLAVRLEDVSVVRNGTVILDGVSMAIRPHERWVLLGPNGSGKTTLLSVVGMRFLPTRGAVEVLGETAGRTDTREMRKRIVFVSQSLLRQLRPTMSVLDAVISGKCAALETWWNEYSAQDRARAMSLLTDARLGAYPERAFGLLSEGERQQVLLARALMAEPELLLMDEPAAGLDLAARERLVSRLGAIVADSAMPPMVLVTHHTEEIPPGTTHAALMRSARVVASGPVRDVINDENLSSCFDTAIRVEEFDGRWFARSR